jgi:short-subunit dehydrogenase
MQLKNKVILLTGADGGIGSSIAKQLYYHGCKLILTGRSANQLEKLNQQMKNHHHIIVADLTQSTDRQHLFDTTERLGGIDGLINNAGMSEFTLIEQQDEQYLETLLTVNVLAPMVLCQLFIPTLKQKSAGFILNMGSTFGSIGYAGFSAYSSSKFAIRGYTETLRRELADSTIQVMYLAPRATNTPINTPEVIAMNQALGNHMDDPEYVANALVRMLEKDQQTVYLGWPEKLFVKINQLFPSLVDWALRSKLATIRNFAIKK